LDRVKDNTTYSQFELQKVKVGYNSTMRRFLNTQKKYRDPDNLRAGLIYGILAGLTFAITTWGIDAFILANNSAGNPWFKFVFGALFCVVVGGFAGWITALADSGLVGAFVWLFAGIAFGWMASHLPFSISSWAMHFSNSRLQDVELVFPVNVRSRMWVVYSLLLVCTILVGILEPVLIESARGARSGFARFLTLWIVAPLLILAGAVTYEYIDRPLTTPIAAVNELLQFHQKLGGRAVNARESAEMHYRALAPIFELANKPYRLYISGYDSEYLQAFYVLVDFQGELAECSVFLDSVGLCKLGMGYTHP
jgi:hypothetical protein